MQHRQRQQPGEGIALLAREVGQHATLLFSLDRLLHEMVTAKEKHLTLAPLDGFTRKLVHTLAEQYGLTTKSFAGYALPPCRRGDDRVYEMKRVVISWAPSARLPKEPIGDMYLRLKGKRNKLDRACVQDEHDVAGALPVWESRRAVEEPDEGGARASKPSTLNAQLRFPDEVLLAIFQHLPCEDLVCAGLVCRQESALRGGVHTEVVDRCLERRTHMKMSRRGPPADQPALDRREWRRYCADNYARWRFSQGDPRRRRQLMHQVKHAHGFLTTTLCSRPHD